MQLGNLVEQLELLCLYLLLAFEVHRAVNWKGEMDVKGSSRTSWNWTLGGRTDAHLPPDLSGVGVLQKSEPFITELGAHTSLWSWRSQRKFQEQVGCRPVHCLMPTGEPAGTWQ